MTIEEIKELLRVFNESGVAELEVTRGDKSLRVRRSPAAQDILAPAGPAPVMTLPQMMMPVPAAPAPPPPAEAPVRSAPAPAADDKTLLVKSPIVGTFYEAPSPGSPPFVKAGDPVEPGQVLCIIESMKLMNEIEAEVAGTLVARLVENGRPVEYGEALFSIRPR
ncbi:MAG: acetyl-CoA carboxylase biotin carboxyl carrier protein [Bryobacteraceae bacterium]|nr:acetyl-CoA carboxylase biotin carboxyl carrier protein [Bryobacteraceae bacterium]